MLKFVKSASLILSMSLSGLAFSGANADVLIVDYKRIESESLAAKHLVKKLESEQTKLNAQATKKEASFKSKIEKLQSQRDIISSAEFAKKQKEIQSEVTMIENDFREKYSALENRKNSALEAINQKISDIAGEVAEEKDGDVVLPANVTLYYNVEHDITNEILRKLNKELKVSSF